MPAHDTLPTAAIDAIFAPFDRPDSPGYALGIIRDGALRYARGYGMANFDHQIPIGPDTVFHVASVSKQFTAWALLLLDRDGTLSLDDDVRDHIPELPDYGAPITIRHLLHHTSGLREQWIMLALAGWRADDVKTNGDVLDLAVRQRALNFPTGSDHLYCNTGYTLGAIIVERASGRTLRAFLHERLFAPLGMISTHFHDDHNEIVPRRASGYLPREGGGHRISIPAFDTVGATSLFTTVEDLARWAAFLDQLHRDDDPRLRAFIAPGALDDGTPLKYALGLMLGELRGRRVVEHSGSDAGYRAHFLWLPEERLAVAILGNLGSLAPGQFAHQIAELCLATDTAEEPAAIEEPIARSAEELAQFVGNYQRADTGALRRFVLRDGRLTLLAYVEFPLDALPGDRFRSADRRLNYRFARDADGTMILHDHDDLGRPIALPAVSVATPPADSLATYAGRYRSDELDVAYTVAATAAGLSLERRKFPARPLVPTGADGFATEVMQLAFTRDAAGAIDGFTLIHPSVRWLRFARIG